MRITGSLPMHIARAYGISPAQRPVASQQPSNVESMRPAAAPDAYQPQRPSGVNQLVAARVDQSVEFDTRSVPRANAPESIPLYTRAADRIEAAVGVHIGRAIDVRG